MHRRYPARTLQVRPVGSAHGKPNKSISWNVYLKGRGITGAIRHGQKNLRAMDAVLKLPPIPIQSNFTKHWVNIFKILQLTATQYEAYLWYFVSVAHCLHTGRCWTGMRDRKCETLSWQMFTMVSCSMLTVWNIGCIQSQRLQPGTDCPRGLLPGEVWRVYPSIPSIPSTLYELHFRSHICLDLQ